jgi:hypothetical protein
MSAGSSPNASEENRSRCTWDLREPRAHVRMRASGVGLDSSAPKCVSVGSASSSSACACARVRRSGGVSGGESGVYRGRRAGVSGGGESDRGPGGGENGGEDARGSGEDGGDGAPARKKPEGEGGGDGGGEGGAVRARAMTCFRGDGMYCETVRKRDMKYGREPYRT